MPENGIFQNPIIAEQAKAEVPFVRDAFLGHTLPKGKEFIGEKEYISLEAMIEEVKQSGKRVILNIGDSSTSGWDSNIVFENRQRYERGEPLRPGFFNYETYSDFLRERLRDRFLVINAGVPAHTSLQGIRRLEQLVEIFKEEGIKLDYVTAYYGNNDCVWERNREDKDWISPSFFRNLRNRFRRTEDRVITRTNPKDYKKNMEGIVKYCRQQGIVPILIEPPTPIYWKPGTRVKGEEIPRRNGKGSRVVYDLLDKARQIWQSALEQKDSFSREMELGKASEMDFVVPRIKWEHRIRLREVAYEQEVSLVSTYLDRSEDDIRYFIDYCHPIGDANKKIAEEIGRVIEEYETGQLKPITKVNKKSSRSARHFEDEDTSELPTDIYPMR